MFGHGNSSESWLEKKQTLFYFMPYARRYTHGHFSLSGIERGHHQLTQTNKRIELNRTKRMHNNN